MAKIKQHELRAYVKPEDYQRIHQESAARGLSVSQTVRACLGEYLKLKEELASSITSDPGQLGDEHTGKIIHTLLARSEERMAVTFERLEERFSELYDQMMMMTAMIDRMYVGFMQHLPELPSELSEAAVASSKRRYEKWLASVEKLLQRGEIYS